MGLIPYFRVITRPNKISVELVKITESIVVPNTPSFEFLEATTTSRFDINNTAIDDAVTMTNDTIDDQLILLSCDFMARCLGHGDYIALKDVSIGELDLCPGLDGDRKLWGMNGVPQCARALWTHLR